MKKTFITIFFIAAFILLYSNYVYAEDLFRSGNQNDMIEATNGTNPAENRIADQNVIYNFTNKTDPVSNAIESKNVEKLNKQLGPNLKYTCKDSENCLIVRVFSPAGE